MPSSNVALPRLETHSSVPWGTMEEERGKPSPRLLGFGAGMIIGMIIGMIMVSWYDHWYDHGIMV